MPQAPFSFQYFLFIDCEVRVDRQMRPMGVQESGVTGLAANLRGADVES
jgi:hypothetical protein